MIIRQQTTERGAVALITAMIVSILLMITTAGMVSVTIKSMRQSTDGAQSTKAYYAAEGGMEETLLKIRNGEKIDNCTGATSASSAGDGTVTCVNVIETPNQLSGSVGKDQTRQLDLSGVTGLSRINVEWSQGGNLAAIPNYTGPEAFRGKQDSTAVRKWSAAAPAVVEVGIIEYPNTPEFTIDSVDFYESILAPKSSNGYAGMVSQDFINYSYSNKDSENKAYVAKCVSTNEYQCSMLVAGLRSDKKYVLRIKTRYNATNYRITALNSSNVPLNIPGANYTIDVTARAGDVFRRIQTSFPKDGNPIPTTIDGLDYVLYSDTDICKSFEVKTSGAVGLSCNPPI